MTKIFVGEIFYFGFPRSPRMPEELFWRGAPSHRGRAGAVSGLSEDAEATKAVGTCILAADKNGIAGRAGQSLQV
jgi:hypothetical protein